jgi:hypothetical protein
MAIVVNQGGEWVQGSSYLGYASLYLQTGAVPAASAEDSGFPASNATSWLTSGGGWQATGAGDKTLAVTLLAASSANSFGIYKHNLGTLGLTVKLQYSSNGTTWTDFTGSEKNPADDTVIYFVGTAPVSASYWRIHIAGMAAGETLIIGQAFIGLSLQVFSPPEPGWVPPNLALNNEFINSRSEGGDFLGRSLIRKGSKTDFSVGLVDAGWVRTNWLPFLTAAEQHPFYHAWDTVNFPLEVSYSYTDKIRPPKYVSSRWMAIDLSFFALRE